MAPTSSALTTKVASGSPYQLDTAQTLKASSALLKHIKSSAKSAAAGAEKKNLLVDADDSDDEAELNETSIWLLLTTKKHIIDKTRLKPAKIALPHPLHTSTATTICLITASPQRTYKDIIDNTVTFPAALSARITRVIDVNHLKKKYKQYEEQRQLFAEHDIFLADDRIVTELPKALGKTFYKSTTKRPIPIDLQANKAARKAGEQTNKSIVIEPKALATNIEKALGSAIVALSPSTLTSIRVGFAGWSAEKVAENIKSAVDQVTEKFVPGKWRGVRGLHIKGPESASLPIWLADELWANEKDVIDDATAERLQIEEEEKKAGGRGKKRKADGGVSDTKFLEMPKDQNKKAKLVESEDSNLDKEIALRKEKLRKQKEEAAKAGDADDSVPAAKTEKVKKAKRKSIEA